MKKYKIQKGLIFQRTSNKTTIFDGSESEIHILNATASLIFEKLKLNWGIEKIVSYLCDTYNVSPEQAEQDVNLLVDELIKKKIIVK